MIRRRIWVSVEVKWVSLLSPWRGRPSHARRAHAFALSKKAGGEAGGPHRPFDLPTEGGIIPPEGNLRERAFNPLPRREPSAGATIAGDAFHLFDHDSTEPDRDLICFLLSL